jgi:hypothetical protein
VREGSEGRKEGKKVKEAMEGKKNRWNEGSHEGSEERK